MILIGSAALAINYQPIIFGSKGLNLNIEPMIADPDYFSTMDKFMVSPGRYSQLLGVITKYPNVASWEIGTMPVTTRNRGLYDYVDSNATHNIMAVMATSESLYNNFYMVNPGLAGWHTLISKEVSSYLGDSGTDHSSFTSYTDNFRNVSTCYFTTSGYYPYKWFSSTGASVYSAEVLSDCNGSATTLTGTVTFTNNSTAVSGAGTAFLSQAGKGRWIKETTTSTWYEIDNVASDTALTLRSAYSGTGGGVITARVAPLITHKPVFIYSWKSRLWILNLASQGTLRLNCSAVVSSTTPAALETWSSTDTGYLFVENLGTKATGIVGLNDYLFIFTETGYNVYRYNASYLPPLELVKSWNYGCPAPNTIKVCEDSIIYYNGYELRQTNGFSDVSISDDVFFAMRYTYPALSFASYFDGTTSENQYPCSLYDESTGLYSLYLSKNTSSESNVLIYDTRNKRWASKTTGSLGSYINAIKYYAGYSYPQIMLASNQADNKLYKLTTYGSTTITGEVKSVASALGDAKQLKNINWIEFWIHVPPQTNTLEAPVYFDFNYFKDGTQALSTPVRFSVSNKTQNDFDSYSKYRVPVNTTCTYFAWNLKDVIYPTNINTSLDAVSILGGIIGYSYVQGN